MKAHLKRALNLSYSRRSNFITVALLALTAILLFVEIAGSETRNSFVSLSQEALEREIVDTLQEDEAVISTAKFANQRIQFIDHRIAPCVGTLSAARTVSFNISDLDLDDTTLRYSARLGSDRVTVRMVQAYQAKSNRLRYEFEELVDLLQYSTNSESEEFTTSIERTLSDLGAGYTIIRSCNGKTYLNEMMTYQISFSVKEGRGAQFLALLKEYQIRFE